MTSKTKRKEFTMSIADYLVSNRHGRLIIAPRFGKTRIIIEFLKRIKPKSVLWVTPSAVLAETGIKEEFSKWGAKRLIKKLITSTYSSLTKIKGEYDQIILDEEQTLTSLTGDHLLNHIIGPIISMTGTPSKDPIKQSYLTQLKLDILIDLSIDEAVDIGVLRPYEINIVRCYLDNSKKLKLNSKYGTYFSTEYDQYKHYDKKVKEYEELNNRYYYHPQSNEIGGKIKYYINKRADIIRRSSTKIAAAKWFMNSLKGRTLSFAPFIDISQEICDYTYNSKTDLTNLLKFQNEEVDQLCLVNTGGVGFTYKNLDNLLLMQSDSDKNGLTTQKLSRILLNSNKNQDVAKIYILCLMNTRDQNWVNSALSNFDKKCIKFWTQ